MLIPRDVLFGNPEKTNPQISPDGQFLAYLAPDAKNVLQVWVRTLGRKDDRAVTQDRKRGIRSYFWTYDGLHLVYQQDADGDENFHLYAVNVKTGTARDLTPFPNIQARVVELDPLFPDLALIAMNRTDPRKHDVYRVNLKTGECVLEAENPGMIVAWCADPQLKIRAAAAAAADGGYDLLLRDSSSSEWKVERHWGPDDQGSPSGFSKDGKTLYLTASHGANALRLVALDLESRQETVVAEDPEYDIGGALVHPIERTIQAVSFVKDRLHWKVLDATLKADFDAIAGIRDGQFGIAGRDLADKTWLVSFVTDDGPVYYYLYRRASKSAELLFSHQPKLEGLPLAKMKPVSFLSRDGWTLHGYLTLPKDKEPKDLPAVLLVHGGPWARDTWGYNATVQWLANRGYAVLQVNFRGSTGYGKKFLNAGNKEWAGKMHNDLLDAAGWLAAQKIADPKKTAIMGGSYGGYATLAALAFTPEAFAAGVDIVGPSNLITLLKTVPPYWAPAKAMFDKRVGSLESEEAFLRKISPLFSCDKIRAPLLIGQGANDPRVKQAESDQIAAAMRRAQKPVEYVIYKDEGHGFARPENRMHFFAQTEAFLARYLGGRFEPEGKIEGHSGVAG